MKDRLLRPQADRVTQLQKFDFLSYLYHWIRLDVLFLNISVSICFVLFFKCVLWKNKRRKSRHTRSEATECRKSTYEPDFDFADDRVS